MIVATAGHVDHGKTALVGALTGVDTDTLAEEKKRGLSIDIGFAYLSVEDEDDIAFMDVPGHERFIKNTLCGLTAADFVLLIVAADDGPMPQTLEHLSVIDLLNVKYGAIVISKIDRVSRSRVEKVKKQIASLTEKTLLRNWRHFEVSTRNDMGVAELRNYLVQRTKCSEGSRADNSMLSNFRMAIDRVFEKKGVGFIVTGTIQSGVVNKDDRVVVAGSDMLLRVRAMHIQNVIANQGCEGQRCALNLTGPKLRKPLIRRGTWVVGKKVVEPVGRFDARIRLLGHCRHRLRHWTPVHLHIATFETTARIALLEGDALQPGQSALAQIVCNKNLIAAFGDAFILRDNSARYTLGGGRVIDIFPPKRGRAKPDRVRYLRLLNHDDAKYVLRQLANNYPGQVKLNEFAANRNLTPKAASELFAGIDKQQFFKQKEKFAVCNQPGNLKDDAGWPIVAKALDKGGLKGVLISELSDTVGMSPNALSSLLTSGVSQGLVVKLSHKLFIDPHYLKDLRDLLIKLDAHANGCGFGLSEFRQATDLGRNRAIEILECFDRQGITRRAGQGRMLLATAAIRFDQLLKRVE